MSSPGSNPLSEKGAATEAQTAVAPTAVAPARVNLIGEHTDYTGGLVLPMAIPFFTAATVEPTQDGRYTFTSDQFPHQRTLAPDDRSEKVGDWSDYSVGVLRELQQLGFAPAPFHLRLRGNVPLGGGLSSSASVEVATAYALLRHLGAQLAPEEIALLCQRAENNYVGSPCGIMDQTVVTLAEEGDALLIETATLKHEAVPMQKGALGSTSIVVCNSMVKHSVATGEYGQRRREVEDGQRVLLEAFPYLHALGEATLPELETVRDRMPPLSFLRCRHIVTENARVRVMRAALLAGDPRAAGQVMLEGHASQRDDFALSCAEIDFLVDTAKDQPGCFGARMTGGGFGGCTVNLVQTAAVERFGQTLAAAYQKQFNLQAKLFVCTPVDGAERRKARNEPPPPELEDA